MSAQPYLTLQVLGPLGFSGEGSDRALPLLRQPKRAAIFAYLTLTASEGWLSREDVLACFWPDAPADRARNALRQSLAFIRTSLGRTVLRARGRDAIGVSRTRVACDAPHFRELLARGAPEDALALYRGEFLAGLDIAAGGAFDAWVTRQREVFRREATEAAWSLAESSEGKGLRRDAAFWGKKALDLSLFSEADARRLLRLLDRVGDYAEALRTYRGLEALLRRRGGAQPENETRGLMEAVRARAAERGDAPPPPCRRLGRDRRRTADRRRVVIVWRLPDRRQDGRRHGERRSGRDRRDAIRL
ncbi:MAG: hypothetical protein AMXMBFR53_24470 [Gemmatimonadota bacterium]